MHRKPNLNENPIPPSRNHPEKQLMYPFLHPETKMMSSFRLTDRSYRRSPYTYFWEKRSHISSLCKRHLWRFIDTNRSWNSTVLVLHWSLWIRPQTSWNDRNIPVLSGRNIVEFYEGFYWIFQDFLGIVRWNWINGKILDGSGDFKRFLWWVWSNSVEDLRNILNSYR